MDRRAFFGTLALLGAPPAAEAQQAAKVARIGFLSLNVAPNRHLGEAFREGLRDLGYVEGRNLVIEYRDAEGKVERLPALAAELVALKVDVIVTGGGTPSALAAKQATRTLPIVFASAPDPVKDGLVTSLARPGGNVTGSSNLNPELGACRGNGKRRRESGQARSVNDDAQPRRMVGRGDACGSWPELEAHRHGVRLGRSKAGRGRA